MRNPVFFFRKSVFCPHNPAVDAGKEIIDVDAHIGIKFRLVENEDVNHRHDHAEKPQPFVGFVFEIQINEADDGADDFEDLHKNV